MQECVRFFAGQPKENYEPITRNLRLNGQSTSIRLERSVLGHYRLNGECRGCINAPIPINFAIRSHWRFMEKLRISPLC